MVRSRPGGDGAAGAARGAGPLGWLCGGVYAAGWWRGRRGRGDVCQGGDVGVGGWGWEWEWDGAYYGGGGGGEVMGGDWGRGVKGMVEGWKGRSRGRGFMVA